MGADIVDLTGKPITIGHNLPPNQEVVDKLESLLERAKTGEIRAIAIAAVHPGHKVGTTFATGNELVSHDLMAAVSYLFHRYAQHKIGE